MQPNIAMKVAEYVAWILLRKHCKFGEKNYYNSRDIEFFLGDCFFWRALYVYVLVLYWYGMLVAVWPFAFFTLNTKH